MFVVYLALHTAIEDNLQEGITDHNSKYCLVCNPNAANIDKNHSTDFNFPKLQVSSELRGQLHSSNTVFAH